MSVQPLYAIRASLIAAESEGLSGIENWFYDVPRTGERLQVKIGGRTYVVSLAEIVPDCHFWQQYGEA